MKTKIYLVLFIISLFQAIYATEYSITITGLAYTPDSLHAEIGDVITISASTTHPLVQVSQTDWEANSTNQLQGGWGEKTENYTFTVNSTDDIYYVCSNHVGSGMKGKIIVSDVTAIESYFKKTDIELYAIHESQGALQPLHIKNDDLPFKVVIYNVSGKKIVEYLINSNDIIYTGLNSGVYIYTIIDQSNAIRGRKRLIIF